MKPSKRKPKRVSFEGWIWDRYLTDPPKSYENVIVWPSPSIDGIGRDVKVRITIEPISERRRGRK